MNTGGKKSPPSPKIAESDTTGDAAPETSAGVPRRNTLARRLGTVGGWTLLSRVFGFLRDLLMARYLGAAAAADAFFIAFKLPNFFRRLFAEGAFSAGFIPLYAERLGTRAEEDSRARADRFAGRVLSWFLPILLLFLILMEAAMVPVMLGLTGGFADNPEKFALTVTLGRLTFPYLVTISLVSLWAGMLNGLDRYAAAAFVPVILNIFMIAALLGLGETEEDKARALAVAVSLSGLGQFLWLFVAGRRAGIRLQLSWPRLDPEIRRLGAIVAPAAVGAGVMQINLLVDIFLAARFLPEGSVSWLFYADRLNQLPVGVIGVGLGTVLLPTISRLLAGGRIHEAMAEQNRALVLGLGLTLPAAAALAVVGTPIIRGLFERAAFTGADSLATGAALGAYAIGLPAYVLAKVMLPGFHARQDTVTPVRIALVGMGVNLALNLLLIGPLAHVGLALGTAGAAWVSVAAMMAVLYRRGHFRMLAGTLSRLVRLMAATLLMTGLLYGLKDVLMPYFVTDGPVRIAALAVLILAGMTSYGLAALGLKALSLKDVKKLGGSR